MCKKKLLMSLLCLVVVLSFSTTATRGANILFVSSMTAVEDDALKAFMEGLGHTVTYIDDDEDEAATEAAAIAADLVFISESVGSGGIKNEITEIEVPMIVGEPWAWDEMGLTEGSGGDDPAVTTDVEIVDPGHYLAAGLSGTVAVLTDILDGCNLGKGITGPEATVIATATLSDGVTYDVIFVYEKGAALPVAPEDGSPQVAADIRIGFGFHANCYPALNENAYALLGAAVDYALGLTGPAGVTIVVEAGGDIAAANEIAKAGDTIEIAEGTFVLTKQIEIKDGVTYRGAGAGLTIIDGNDTTRAFAAWGDRGATNGQVDAAGVGVPNTTGPKGWVLEGMTIQNCVADTANRQDILSAARDLLNNYTGTPYTLETAQAENGGIADNPGWFDILSGGADDNLTDVELQAYLDNNPPGSAGHLVANDDQDGDGGAITIHNGAVGTIQSCDFLYNHTPAGGGDDGGAVNITGLSVVTIDDCWFDGNYAVSPDSVAVDGSDGDAGHIKVQGSSASAITPGTTLIAKRSVFLNGNVSDDGGAIQSSAVGSIIRLDACWFEGNTAADDGTVLFIGNESSGELTVTNCIFANNISSAASDRMCQVRRNSKFINCTFVGNNQDDQALIHNNANSADTDADGTDDEIADVTQVVNCIFLNNIVGNGDDILKSRNNDFSIAATNCIFFGNTLQNGNAADNTQRPNDETGSIEADPLLDVVYVPEPGSPAIDAGIDPAIVGVTLTTDLDGNPRPQGAGYDIGAYEVAAN